MVTEHNIPFGKNWAPGAIVSSPRDGSIYAINEWFFNDQVFESAGIVRMTMAGRAAAFIDPYYPPGADTSADTKALTMDPSGNLWFPNGDGLDEFYTHP